MNEVDEVVGEFLVFPSLEEEGHKWTWTHQNTLVFLELYKNYREQVGSLKLKNFKKMFEEIAKEMQRIIKTKITGAICENRWKVLERNYKKYIDNSKLTGRERKAFEYADVMHSILGHKKNIHPVLLLSSNTINTLEASEKDKENMSVTRIVESKVQDRTDTVVSPIMKRRPATVANANPTENKRLKYNILKEIRSDRNEYYKKRLEIEEKKLSEKKRKNVLLEKHNILLEKYLDKNNSIPIIDVIP